MWRKDDHYLIYGRPWLTDLSAHSNHSILSSIGVPSTVTIKGDSLSYVKLSGFHGWFKIDDEKAVHEEGVYNWEIKEIEPGTIYIDAKSIENSRVLITVKFQGKASDLIINNKNYNSFKSNFIKNIYFIWSNSIFQGILLILISLIIYTLVDRKGKGNN